MNDPDQSVREATARRYTQYVFPAVKTYYDEPVVVHHGSGTRLYDVDGSEYLDFFGGILTVQVGHANPHVVDHVTGQIERFSHSSTLYQIPPMAELAEKLSQITPGRLQKSFFSNSGTEANEAAITAARAFTGREEIIALRHSYHGRSQLTRTLTGISPWRSGPSYLPNIRHALSPYCYRCPLGMEYPACSLRCAHDVRELIETTTAGRVAAMIVEPIQGVGGFITPPPEYFRIVADIVREYGGIFIADEVQTGFGRTGDHWFGIEHWGVEPDVATCAKGMANGAPIGVTIATAEVADAYPQPTISTFGGNPVSTTASLATIEVIEQEGLLQRVSEMGAHLRQGLEDIQAEAPVIGDVRGKGLMLGLELVRPQKEPAPDLASLLIEQARARGLLLGRGGMYSSVLRVTPPLTVSMTEIDEALEIMRSAFREVQESTER